jgi:hypothetical protein
VDRDRLIPPVRRAELDGRPVVQGPRKRYVEVDDRASSSRDGRKRAVGE